MFDPNPFHPHPDGPWHKAKFGTVVAGVTSLLARYRRGEVSERHLLRGNDTGRDKRDTLSYWLYFQHHPGSECWKILGQRYWSAAAYRAFRDCFNETPSETQLNRRDKGPATSTIPKRSTHGESGLVSEHVVPKKTLKQLLLVDKYEVAQLLRINLCAVVTRAEDRCLLTSKNRKPFDPWNRYARKGIEFISNPDWTKAERAALEAHGLLATATSPL